MHISKGFRISDKEKIHLRISIEKLFDLRAELRNAVDRCMCTKKAMQGICHPPSCYFELYSLLYPRGGYYPRSKRGEQLFLRSTQDSVASKKEQQKKSKRRKNERKKR